MKHTRWIAMLLCLCMVLGLLPTAALAAPAAGYSSGISDIAGSFDMDTLLAAGDEVYGESEPNDDAENANWIWHDLTIAATLSGEDEDYYAFELTDASPVTIISAGTSEDLIYGLFEYESGELVAECEYLGLDEESGLHMHGFSCELPPSIYVLIVLDMEYSDVEYLFYLEAPGYGNEPHYHDYGDGVVTKKATCTENGVITYTCSCGDSYTEEILAEGHKFSGDKCSVCGASGDEIIASGEHDSGPVTWKLSAKGVLTISGSRSMQDKSQSGYEWADYSGMITRVVIENGITNVPKGAFANYPNLESVSLGNKVEVIKEDAFSNCVKLTEVTIPAATTQIEESAFYGCGALKTLKFESGSKLTKIGDYAFYRAGITAAELPGSLTAIGESAFQGCAKLATLTLPDGLESISWNAFADCAALKKLVIPASVTDICLDSFANCAGLEHLEIYTNQLFGDQFANNPKLKTLVLGDQITQLQDSFKNCTGLTSLTLSKNLTEIGSGAFENCSALTAVSLPEGLKKIDLDAFRGTGLTALVIPDSVTELGMSCFNSCKKLATVKVGKGVKEIPNYAFADCVKLTTVEIETVELINSNAFAGCSSLTSVEMSSVTEIMMEAFKGCTALESIILPDTLERMDHSVFSGCTALKTVTFNGDAPAFSGSTFAGYTGEVLYPYDNDTWTEEAMQDYGGDVTWRAYSNEPDPTGTCGENVTWTLNRISGILTISGTGAMSNFKYDSLPWSAEAEWITAVVMNEGVTTIGENAFYHLDNLTSVSLPEGLQVIGQGAFSCSGITEIDIPVSVIQLHANAFESCFDLKKINVSANNKYYSSDKQGILYDKEKTELIACPQGFVGVCTIPSGVKEIAELAFHYCDKLTSVTIPGSVTTIGKSAFQGCYGLESVALAEGLLVIGESAFADCSALTEITIPDGVTTIEAGAFSCAGLTEIVFQGGVPAIADYAFEGVTATAYYPLREDSWTADALKNYGGTLKWVKEAYVRVFGSGRSETAIAAAEELKEVLGIEKFDTIILASGEGFADALAGSYLAVKKDAPILLVQKSTIELNKNYILNNLAQGGSVYILGGTAAVPQEMEDALEGLNVKRLQGDDRYETNLLILEEAGIRNEEILICTGWDFADSLSASATGLPILMLNTGKNELTKDQIAFLEKYADNDFTIIGGTAAVSEALETAVKAVVGEVDRVYGESRENTSVEVAKRYFSVPDYAVVAYSRNFPDGLCGGPLAHALNAPLLLVSPRQETSAAEYIKTQGITQGFVLGGTAAVTEDSARIVYDLK